MMNTRNETIKIGTSGIVLPGPKSTFPTELQNNTRLHYYASLFDTLEINSSFYKIPLPSTFTKWKSEVPDNFKFTIKLWRGITHKDDLKYDVDDVEIFMRSINHLKEKSGCLLIQLPATITIRYLPRVEALLVCIQKLPDSEQCNIAIELRHKSWYHQDIYELFNVYKVSIVYHDMPGSKTPFEYNSFQFAYFRFHGPTGNYTGTYDESFLEVYAERIRAIKEEGKDVYVYFNNTIGEAFNNAQLLKNIFQIESVTSQTM